MSRVPPEEIATRNGLDIASAADSLEDAVFSQLADVINTEAPAYRNLAPDVVAVAYAHIAAKPQLQYSARHLAHQTGLPLERVKLILGMREFEVAVREALNAGVRRQVSAIHKSLYLYALKGSPAHIKIFLERFDKPELMEDATLTPQVVLDFLTGRGLTHEQAVAIIAGQAVITPKSEVSEA